MRQGLPATDAGFPTAAVAGQQAFAASRRRASQYRTQSGWLTVLLASLFTAQLAATQGNASAQATAPADTSSGSASVPSQALSQTPQLFNPTGTPAWQLHWDGRYANASTRALLTQPCNDTDRIPLFQQPGTCQDDSYSLHTGLDPVAGCVWELGLYGSHNTQLAQSNLNMQLKESESDCCAACRDAENNTVGCNSWSWCGNPTGCCGLAEGCRRDDLENLYPHKLCILRSDPSLTPENAGASPYPAKIYSPKEISSWQMWPIDGINYISTCKAFTSGVHTRRLQGMPQPQGNFTMQRGMGFPGGNIECSRRLGNDTLPADQPASCRMPGGLEALMASCELDGRCDAVLQQPMGCCGDAGPDSEGSGWLKSYSPNQAQCTVVQPYSDLYVFNGIHVPLPKSKTTAIIAGAVAGGVGALILAALLALCICCRGRWRASCCCCCCPASPPDPQPDKLPAPPDKPVPLPDYSHAGWPGHRTQSWKLDAHRELLGAEYVDSAAECSSEWTSARSRAAGGSSSYHSFRSASLHSADSIGPAVLELPAVTPKSLVEEPRGAWEVQASDITLLHSVGKGGFGEVFKGLRHGVEVVAVKVLTGHQDEAGRLRFIKEINLLKQARHPHVVMYLGCCMQGDRIQLVTEFCERGDLWTELSRDDSKYTWYRKGRQVALDVAYALHYLHTNKVMHLDIKSGNVLLSRDGTAKVADVGLARIARESHCTRAEPVGSWAWIAPEVILGTPVTILADVFSYGVLLWEICTQERPERGQLRELKVPRECPARVSSLIWSCQSFEASNRPDMRAIIAELLSI